MNPVSSAGLSSGKKRFHILYSLRYFRYGLLLCLVPLARALFALDLDRLFSALYKDALILLLSAAGALALWLATGFSFDGGEVAAESGIFYKNRHVYAASSIAALEISRPLYCRILGASHVTLHFKNLTAPSRLKLYLNKRDAAALADGLMPVRGDTSVFAPTGIKRLNLVVLSANVLTSCAFVYMTIDHMDEFFDQDFHAIAAENVSRIIAFAEHWLPAGISALAALLFLLVTVAVLYSFLHTMGFSVCRNGGVIIARGGLVTKIERRIRVASVTSCEVRVTPVARLLRRYPVYVRAGSFNGGDIPLMLCRKGAEDTARLLLPGYTVPEGPLCAPGRKSPGVYVWKPAACLALFLGMLGVAFASAPSLLPIPLLACILAFGALLVSLEGIAREGVCKNSNRTLSVCYTRNFTRHDVCVLTSDLSYSILETPFGISSGLCNLSVHLPCRVTMKVRSIPTFQAAEIPFTL